MKYCKYILILLLINISHTIYADDYFKIKIKESLDPVVAKIDEYNNITITSLPKKFIGELKFSNISIGTFYPSGINIENCKQVENRAKNAMNPIFPEDVRYNQKKLVRFMSPTGIDIYSGINFSFSTFEKTLKQEASKLKHLDESVFNVQSDFIIDKITYKIEYTDNSITNIIGNTSELENQINRMINERLFSTGSTSIDTTYTDLICDLFLKRAKLKMYFSGGFGKHDYTYSLLNNYEIINIYNEIINHKLEYFEKSIQNARIRNLALSAVFLNNALKIFNIKDIDNTKFIAIYERIISLETGEIIQNLDNDSLSKLMQVQSSKLSKFEAEVFYENI